MKRPIEIRWYCGARLSKPDARGFPKSLDGQGNRGRGAMALTGAVLSQGFARRAEIIDRETQEVLYTRRTDKFGNIITTGGKAR